ncbi:MAG: hypothetical protein H6978_03970 [Gammaproteobacteria bacterium]|nr:hypothetical protein [Gammaproteobacteria bacterium]
MATMPLDFDHYPLKLGAVYPDRSTAQRVIRHLLVKAGVSARRIRVLDPPTANQQPRRVQQAWGLENPALRAYLALGGVGLALGLMAGRVATAASLTPETVSSTTAMAALGVFGMVTGMSMIALLLLRQRSALRIASQRRPPRRKRCMVVVQVEDDDSRHDVEEVLQNARPLETAISTQSNASDEIEIWSPARHVAH